MKTSVRAAFDIALPTSQGVAALALLVGAVGPLQADEIYRWVDKNGVVHYGDRPGDASAKPAELPELQRMPAAKSGVTRISATPTTAAAPAAARYGLRLLSPQPDDTVRGAERRIEVLATTDAPVPDGYSYGFYLDGALITTSASPSAALTEVDRGSHLVSVALLDAAGNEVGRSDPVIVHVKPPVVKP